MSPISITNETTTRSALFVLGKTKVFFKVGALEYMESQRANLLDASCAKIQARIRGNKARVQYAQLLLVNARSRAAADADIHTTTEDGCKEEENEEDEAEYECWMKSPLESPIVTVLFIIPLYLYRYVVGVVRRPFGFGRGSWH